MNRSDLDINAKPINSGNVNVSTDGPPAKIPRTSHRTVINITPESLFFAGFQQSVKDSSTLFVARTISDYQRMSTDSSQNLRAITELNCIKRLVDSACVRFEPDNPQQDGAIGDKRQNTGRLSTEYFDGYQQCVNDVNMMYAIRRSIASPNLMGSSPSFDMAARAQVYSIKQLVDSSLDRLQAASPGQVGPESNECQKSPEPRSFTENSHDTSRSNTINSEQFTEDAACRITPKIKKVMSHDDFNPGDKVCSFEGTLVYRVPCSSAKDRYYLFTTVESATGLNVQFLDNDTEVAWSGIKISHSGRPAVEIGCSGTGNARYIRHSKDNNVEIIVSGFNSTDTIAWGNRDALRFDVVAKKNIKQHDELLMDYDDRIPDIKSDLNLPSLIATPASDKKESITQLIGRLHSGSPQSGAKKKHYDTLALPVKIRVLINGINEYNNKYTKKYGLPIGIDDLKNGITDNDRSLLKAILIPEQPDMDTLELVLEESDINNKYTNFSQNLSRLKAYFEKSFFNGRQTRISINEVKELLNGSESGPKKRHSIKKFPH